jgi:hypothetical protein
MYARIFWHVGDPHGLARRPADIQAVGIVGGEKRVSRFVGIGGPGWLELEADMSRAASADFA